MLNFQFVVSTIAFTFLTFVSPAQSAIETGATPPTSDETLIYVMRDWRFAGGGGSFWIAVNDQTVDRLSNGRYAVVRAKAGRITLNLAIAGMVVAPVALDDRPGETVYLKWRVGDLKIREVSETEGREFLKKAKRSKGIEKPLPNNEEIDALANLSRMGFDLTRPASQKIEPDSKHGVITLFRREDGRNVELGIWSDQGFVSTLKIKQGTRLRAPTGDHYFLAGNKGASILKAEIQASKEYFVWLDFGEGFGGVRLTPVSLKQVKQLKKWLKPVDWVELDTGMITSRIRERGKMVNEFVQNEAKNSGSKRSNLQFLGPDHAFDEKMLMENEISTLITEKYNNQIARLERSTSSSSQNSNGIDVSGEYVSEFIGDKHKVFGRSRVLVNLTQEGSSFSGTLTSDRMRGEVWGKLEGRTLKFKWFTDAGWDGVGKWKMGDDNSILLGSWQTNGARVFEGKWNINRSSE